MGDHNHTGREKQSNDGTMCCSASCKNEIGIRVYLASVCLMLRSLLCKPAVGFWGEGAGKKGGLLLVLSDMHFVV